MNVKHPAFAFVSQLSRVHILHVASLLADQSGHGNVVYIAKILHSVVGLNGSGRLTLSLLGVLDG